MLSSQALKFSARLSAGQTLVRRAAVGSHASPGVFASSPRLFSSTPRLRERDPDDKYHSSSTAAEIHDIAAHEGQFARTNRDVRVEYPEEEQMPRSKVIQGRGGFHLKRTLASFSLENKVAIVTGGARGLGLVMGQALVASGADLAIVDLNSMSLLDCSVVPV